MRGGEKVSTLDLLGRGFVLLTAPQGAAWRKAAAALAGSPRVETITLDDTGSDWLQAYGLEAQGAVLVRPDGHVAWRSRGSADDPAAVLAAALDAVLCRPAQAAGSAA